MLQRYLQNILEKTLLSPSYEIIFIWGPRRSGKSTILQNLATKYNTRVFNFDLSEDREYFQNNYSQLKKLAENFKLILIDEVQNYPESTQILKILHDEFKLKIVATGSTELRNISAPDFDSLAGRFITYYCFPLSYDEILYNQGTNILLPSFKLATLQNLLVYGGYPATYLEADLNNKILSLQQLIDTYILKDIVSIYNLKDVQIVRNLLIKLAMQIGQEISQSEVATKLQVDIKTLQNYLNILTVNNILIEHKPYFDNPKKQISKNKKYFFVDLGIRNSLINDFRQVNLRNDKGMLFENFVITEFNKEIKTKRLSLSMFFYREYNGREVDIVLQNPFKKFVVVEIKYKERNRTKNPFPIESNYFQIDSENFDEVKRQVFEELKF